jgi:lipoprotein-anchoring transpeptidase ErfK/SrfK
MKLHPRGRLALIAGMAALSLATACATATVSGTAAPTSMVAAAAPVTASSTVASTPAAPPAPVAAVSTPAPPKPNMCAGNTQAQFVLVVIGVQHAWMCSHSTLVYQSAVTTGIATYDDETPTGTWHVQSIQGARYLTLLNGTRYHVEHWIPFDGVYGFHDAAWQTFPEGSALYKTQGSHGCVHLPMTAMVWLSKWVQVGATVTVRSA